MKPRALIAAIALAATSGLPGTSDADQNLNCDAYAAAAVAQQNENLALGCGYTSGGWSTDFAGHRDWCLQANLAMANLTEQDRGRSGALEICRAKAQACDNYATLAVLQNSFSQNAGCGFSGGAWSDNGPGHRRWCMTAPPQASQAEMEARATALGTCNASMAEIDMQKATQQQQQVLQMMSNISKLLHDSSTGVLKKIGG